MNSNIDCHNCGGKTTRKFVSCRSTKKNFAYYAPCIICHSKRNKKISKKKVITIKFDDTSACSIKVNDLPNANSDMAILFNDDYVRYLHKQQLEQNVSATKKYFNPIQKN